MLERVVDVTGLAAPVNAAIQVAVSKGGSLAWGMETLDPDHQRITFRSDSKDDLRNVVASLERSFGARLRSTGT